MTLKELTEKARRLIAAGDPGGAEKALAEGVGLASEEASIDVLADYALACHYWASETCEEVALREAMRCEARLSEVVQLLDLLQQRLNSEQGEGVAAIRLECLQLGDVALELVSASESELQADLAYNRGLRKLELARGGRSDLLPGAEQDIELYVKWLSGESESAHFKKANMLASSRVDLGEILLLQGRSDEAAKLLRAAIEHMEAEGMARWRIDGARELLRQLRRPPESGPPVA